MKIISDETRKLLDELYNLRGKDSVILSKIASEKATCEDTKRKAEENKKSLEQEISRLKSDEKILADQGEKLKSALKSIKKADFTVVLERLNIDFDPEDISKKLSESLPETIEKVVNEKKKDEDDLVSVEKEMDEAITNIEELSIRKDEALASQKKLNEYFEMSLKGNINVTRDAITTLLEKFKFTEDEQREAAKILMFPEDALYEYNESIKSGEKTGMTISEVIAEAKESSVKDNDLTSIDNLIKDDVKEEETKIISKEPEVIKIVEPVEDKETKKTDIKEFLTSKGIEVSKIASGDLKNLKDDFDEKNATDNIDYLNKININKEFLLDNIEFINDKELKAKIDYLLQIGKTTFDIYLNPNVLSKYNLQELNNTIKDLQESGLDPKKVPLMAF